MATVKFTSRELDEFVDSFIERSGREDEDRNAIRLRLQYFMNECVNDIIEDIVWFTDGFHNRAEFYRNWENAERTGTTQLKKILGDK